LNCFHILLAKTEAREGERERGRLTERNRETEKVRLPHRPRHRLAGIYLVRSFLLLFPTLYYYYHLADQADPPAQASLGRCPLGLPPHPPHLIAAFAAAAGLGVCKCFKNTQRGLQQQQKQLIFHQFCSGKNKQPQENNHRNDNTFFYYYGRYQFFVPPPHQIQ
jgi:hypothetical protein